MVLLVMVSERLKLPLIPSPQHTARWASPASSRGHKGSAPAPETFNPVTTMSRLATTTLPSSSFLAFVSLVIGVTFVSQSEAAGEVWNPSSTWTYYAPIAGAPRHHSLAGCYSNLGGVLDPVLPDGKRTISGLTRDKCMAQCINYPFFGMGGSNGDFCTCGSAPLSALTPAAGQCSTPCSGESGVSCGGTFALSVYSITSCSTQASCGPGYYQSAICTTTTDRVCTQCETGNYCIGDGLKRACNTSVSCGPGMYETAACNTAGRTEDRECSFCGGCSHRTGWSVKADLDTTKWHAYATAIRTPSQEPAITAALRAATNNDPGCEGDPQFYCPGDAQRYTAPAGYYTVLENGELINPYSSAADPNMRTKKVKCGDAVFYCPGDGLRYKSRPGYYTTGAETGEAANLNLTRTAEVACGGEHVFCPGDGKQYYVNRGFYTTGQTITTRTGRAQCGNHTFWCPGDGRKYPVSVGYITTGNNYTTRFAQEKCGAVVNYCHGGLKYTAPRGTYTVGAPGLTSWPDGLGPEDVRVAKMECGTGHADPNRYYCPGDGKKYVVPEGYETHGETNYTRYGFHDCTNCRFYCTHGVRYVTGKGYYSVGGTDCSNHNARRECGGCVEQPLKEVWLTEGLSRWYCNGDGIRRQVPAQHFSTDDGAIGGDCAKRSGLALASHWVDCPYGSNGELCKVSTNAEGELQTDVPSVPVGRYSPARYLP